ncbi:peptidoglycan bridge formation glycyltransferase FemA/FemB family protein [Patescibacteria group bacterium]|nr:peptidoglycan bridge formation glycyltransferase FemA/FemB family protein [Patescibacteria group bacterium]
MDQHVMQSPLWARFKSEYGTPAVISEGTLYTKHKIPFTSYYFAYCPRVDPFKIKFDSLEKSLKENSCVAVHFDVPNIIEGTKEAEKAKKIFEERCVLSGRNEFARGNLLLDITKSDDELLENMYKKHRYNINYAERKGVVVEEVQSDSDFDIFYSLYKKTAERQAYYFRVKGYLSKLWDIFHNEGKAHILIAKYDNTPLAAWLLLVHGDVIYYPYGGSSEEYKNLHGSCLIGWETIKLGKKLGCKSLDMWGAAEDLNDKSDPYHGFSVFKSKFGPRHATYLNSYDFVVNNALYKMFIRANDFRWKLLKFLK